MTEDEALKDLANRTFDTVLEIARRKADEHPPSYFKTLEASRFIFVGGYVAGANDILDSLPEAQRHLKEKFLTEHLRAAVAAKLAGT